MHGVSNKRVHKTGQVSSIQPPNHGRMKKKKKKEKIEIPGQVSELSASLQAICIEVEEICWEETPTAER